MSGAGHAARAGPGEPAGLVKTLRVVSANLRNGHADPDAFAALVVALEADVVAVQELAPPQARALERVLPFGHLDPSSSVRGMGVALRHPGRVWRLPLPYRGAYIADVPAGEAGAVEIINVHIIAPQVGPPWRALAIRRGQLRGLLDHLEATPGRPRGLVGDLNATPLWGVYRRLTRRLSDAALAVSRRDGRRPRATWGPGPGTPRLLRIDHVLTEAIEILDVQVVPIDGGDHSALVVDLRSQPVEPAPVAGRRSAAPGSGA